MKPASQKTLVGVRVRVRVGVRFRVRARVRVMVMVRVRVRVSEPEDLGRPVGRPVDYYDELLMTDY